MFNLWRQYPTMPFYRWACEVTPDPEAAEGFRVLRHDPIVADTVFFHRLSDAMTSTHEAMARRDERAVVAHVRVRVAPGADDHFEHAIRGVEGAILGLSPERMKTLNDRSAA